jgi:hypothetical protein
MTITPNFRVTEWAICKRYLECSLLDRDTTEQQHQIPQREVSLHHSRVYSRHKNPPTPWQMVHLCHNTQLSAPITVSEIIILVRDMQRPIAEATDISIGAYRLRVTQHGCFRYKHAKSRPIMTFSRSSINAIKALQAVSEKFYHSGNPSPCALSRNV